MTNNTSYIANHTGFKLDNIALVHNGKEMDYDKKVKDYLTGGGWFSKEPEAKFLDIDVHFKNVIQINMAAKYNDLVLYNEAKDKNVVDLVLLLNKDKARNLNKKFEEEKDEANFIALL